MLKIEYLWIVVQVVAIPASESIKMHLSIFILTDPHS